MLADYVFASVLMVCMACFFIVNLHNILVSHKKRNSTISHAEVESPSGRFVSLAAVGTFTHFLLVLGYIFLVFTDTYSLPKDLVLRYRPPFIIYLQIIGTALTTLGYALFIWSVIVRGQYATSWEMKASHKLIINGPYKYVRHPSYLGYFLMFFGLLALWPHPITLIPLAAIPGYVKVTDQEEKLLTQRFGKEYTEYQKKTPKFIPRP